MRDHLFLYLNGEPLEVRGESVFRTLSAFLREERGATGTKIVCEEGDCGACTVLVGTVEGGELAYRPVNSCILPLHQADGTHVVTVEGVAERGTLNALQESMVRHHGAQCGFCTPGFVTAMTVLYEGGDAPTERQVREGLTGNLCRCTGYDPIVKAALAVDGARLRRLRDLYPSRGMVAALERAAAQPVRVAAGGHELHAPTTLRGAVEARGGATPAVIVQGATDVGVWRNKRGWDAPVVLSLSRVPGMSEVRERDGVLEVGGAATLATLEEAARARVRALAAILGRFGSPQIRAVGTLAGNLANASPIADTLPCLFVMEARVELTGPRGARQVDVRDFYRGYKTLDMGPDELISRVLVPLPGEGETLRLYKVSKRRDLDISTFTAAVRMREEGGRVGEIRIAYGGVGPVVLRLPRAEAWLAGREIDEESFAAAGRIAREEISPISDGRGSRDFRLQLAENVLLKFYNEHVGEEVPA
jgi:xanthine dehydrogenase small subunit